MAGGAPKMIEHLQEKSKVRRTGSGGGKGDELPYRIELSDAADGDTFERVLARAFNAPLARAIFQAAQAEHPGRRILLCRGTRIVADSAK
jgi:hypothetical protein